MIYDRWGLVVMADIPKRPEDVFTPLVEDYRRIFGDGLEAIILYGSGARGSYLPRKSDLNFLIVVSGDSLKRLAEAVPIVAKWRKRRVAVPLVMSERYIESSLDVFPIEFLDMKTYHRVVFGRNILAGLNIKRPHVRLQLERELKGKTIQLRRGFLETADNERGLRELIGVSMKAFLSYFTAMVYLCGFDIPSERTKLVDIVEEHFGLEGGILRRCLAVLEGRDRPPKSELLSLCLAYMELMEKLCYSMDVMELEINES